MNSDLEAFARQYIKDGLAKLSESCHQNFKLMYARADGKRNVADALAMDINIVVDEMESFKLNHAMTQVKNSLIKENRNGVS